MVAAIVGVASLAAGAYGASKQAGAAKDAANAQQQGAANATAEQQREFNIDQQNQAPWLNIGSQAENALGSLYGFSPLAQSSGGSSQPGGYTLGNGMTANAADATAPRQVNQGGSAAAQGNSSGTPGQLNYAQFLNSPDYQWALQQGTGNLDASAAAKGNLYSGGYGNTLVNYNQGMASQQLNNYANRLAQIAGGGQNTAMSLGNAGANMANQVGANDMYAGNAAANGYINNANVWAGYANNLGSTMNQFATAYGNRSQPPPTSYGGFNSPTGQGEYTGPGAMPNYNYLSGLGG